MIRILGAIDILSAIFCLLYPLPAIASFFASLLIIKGIYSLAMAGNLLDPLGLIDILAGAAYFLNWNGYIYSIIFIILGLKGLSSFAKL
jgi:hypothetical protein